MKLETKLLYSLMFLTTIANNFLAFFITISEEKVFIVSVKKSATKAAWTPSLEWNTLEESRFISIIHLNEC